jgi:GcrA cell cycle regulator
MMMSNTSSPWSDDRIAKLRWLAEEGASATIIAAALSQPTHHFSRNAVIGKAHRLRIHLTGKPTRSAKPAPEIRLVRGRGRPPKAAPGAAPAQPRAHLILHSAKPPPEPVGLKLKVVDLTDHTCRWPHGDPADPSFCGHEPHVCDTERRLPYCEPHARVAYANWRAAT